jgi:hypothetical protein
MLQCLQAIESLWVLLFGRPFEEKDGVTTDAE